jgi:CO/xanthine dehydrogenase Mo-binding subunit
MSAPVLPLSLKTNPRLDRWLQFNPDRSVTVRSGKVELGQGIVTAIAQIAAEELDVSLDRLRWVAGDTSASPDEWYTAGSQSIEVGGRSMRLVCAEVRQLFLQAAAQELEVGVEELQVNDGVIGIPGTDVRTSYWDLAPRVSLARDVTGTAPPKPAAAHSLVGKSIARRDLAAKLSGAAYVHDMELPGMVHARILRPPALSASLEKFDAASVRALPGVVAVVVSGNFIGLCAEREEQALKALAAAERAVSWKMEAALPETNEIGEFLDKLPSTRNVVHEKKGEGTAVARLEARYTKPYLAHASIGPSCALARVEAGHLTIWSHTQGPHNLRAQVAAALRMPVAEVDVIHRDGPGCYGHNGADDVALDAALLARACGRPVRVQWTRADEFTWSPCGSAMIVRLRAGLDAGGRVVDWQHEIWSHTHIKRPGWGEGINLLAAWHMDPPHPVPPPKDTPLPTGGATRNSIPLYDFPRQEIAYNFIADMPLRVSALRTLGAYMNIFAIESFMDELAAAARADPVEFRLRHLSDARAREVIEEVTKAAATGAALGAPGTFGRGIGFGRYKNMSAWCAVIADIEVAEKIRVHRVYAAVDAGEVVNPDGLRNQIEGGIVQAISWTLKEAIRWDRDHLLSRTWEDYPILKFNEVPAIEVLLLDRPGLPGLGVGECAAGPTAAALSNALANALGVRARDLPFTPERIAAAM